MTLPIHDQGGLTEAEIALRIEQSRERQVAELDSRLRQHEDAIDRRLAATDAVVQDTRERTIELKASLASITDNGDRQARMLESVSEDLKHWREGDIDFRAVLVQQVSKIEAEQKRLTEQMNLLRWAAATSGFLMAVGKFLVGQLKETEMWKLVVLAFLLEALHRLSPYIYTLVHPLLVK